MKSRKKDTKPTETIPGLLACAESVSFHGESGLRSAKRTRFRLFQLETVEERAALQGVCSGLRDKQEFRRLLRAHLALIADVVTVPKAKKLPPSSAKPSNILRNLERRAKSVRVFAERMGRPVRARSSFGITLILPIAPIRELHRYADELEDCARRQRSRGTKPPRHEPRRETRLIVNFADFVRRTTGSPYWRLLAVLLRRPTGLALNEKSLEELVKYHKSKARRTGLLSLRRFHSFPRA